MFFLQNILLFSLVILYFSPFPFFICMYLAYLLIIYMAFFPYRQILSYNLKKTQSLLEFLLKTISTQ